MYDAATIALALKIIDACLHPAMGSNVIEIPAMAVSRAARSVMSRDGATTRAPVWSSLLTTCAAVSYSFSI
jgi:hypothetical protein